MIKNVGVSSIIDAKRLGNVLILMKRFASFQGDIDAVKDTALTGKLGEEDMQALSQVLLFINN